MKKRVFLFTMLLGVFGYSAHAQDQNKDNQPVEGLKKEVFTVYGNCGMCERTIEGSLKDVEGVSLADWDKETDLMTVEFDPAIITLDAIKQKIADVGYDSDTHRAKDEVYNSLPGCCHYERPKK